MASHGPILVVDDSPSDLELVLEAFRRCELPNEIHVARDGVEALDYLYHRAAFSDRPIENPVLMLLDLKMPRLNGLDVLAKINGDADLCHLPVVMFTASRQESDLIASHKLGVNAFVVKPTDFRELSKAIRDIAFFWAARNEPPPRKLAHA